MSTQRSKLPYLLAVLGAAAVVLAAWVNRDRIQPVVAGTDAPHFELENSDGQLVGLDEYRGTVVLVNVWATWCGPCIEEMPSMERLYQEFDREDFEILAISIDAPPGQFDALGRPGGDPAVFAADLGTTFPVLLNPSGDIQRTYQTTGVPESFVIGRDGVIYKKVAGSTTWDVGANMDLVRRLVEGQ